MKPWRAVAAGLLLAGLAAAPVGAAGSVEVGVVDARAFPEVQITVAVDGPAPKTAEVSENGEPVSEVKVAPVWEAGKSVGSVLVLDTSSGMRAENGIDRMKAAARQFVEARTPGEWTAVVSFGSQVVLRQGFTQDAGPLLAAIDSLVPSGGRNRWDAVVAGARLLGGRPELAPGLVMITAGPDTGSGATEDGARAALSTAHVSLHTVGVNELETALPTVRQAVSGQYVVSYRSPGEAGALAIDLTVAGRKAQVLGRSGSAGTAPKITTYSPRGGPAAGALGKVLVPALAAGTAVLLVTALLLIFGRRRAESLEGRLEPYAMGNGFDGPGFDEAPSQAESTMVQRAVRFTHRMAGRTPLLDKVGSLLEQANLPLRPAEGLFFYLTGVLLVTLLLVVAAPSAGAGLVVAAIVAIVPVAALKSQRRRRLKAFEAQLPDTLNLISGSLRAGYSFLQGLEAVAQETSEPTARELRRVLTETRLGRGLEDALSDTAVRMASRDFDWAVLAIRIQREVGGNLAELLQTVADTMLQRSRIRGEIRALTAEGRLSAIVMGCLPVGLGLFMFSTSPEYIGTLFTSTFGWAMVIGSVIMACAGFFWLQKIVKIEV